MLALIMAGGEGSRLNLGEKPLVTVAGQPMIAYVIRAFRDFGCDVIVVASKNTPMTKNWCRASGIGLFCADGSGYIEDMVDAVQALGEQDPLFIAVCDLPCLNAGIIRAIYDGYVHSGKDACSVWVPVPLIRNQRDMQYQETIGGINASPCGINILRGDLISGPQEEFRMILDEPRLAYNVNTRADLSYADTYLRTHR